MRKLIIAVIISSLAFCGAVNAVGSDALQKAIGKSQKHLLKLQHSDGHWEGKIHINPRETAYYLLVTQYIGMGDKKHRNRSGQWLITHQHPDGSWGFFDEGGEGDLSITALVSLALETVGTPKNSQVLIKAREYINSHGGYGAADIFTTIFYALYGKLSWKDKALTLPPIEIMLLPKDSEKSIYKMNTWVREGMLPLMVLKTLNKSNLTIAEQEALKEAELWIVSHQLEDGSWYTQLPTSLNMIALYKLNWEKHKPRIMISLEWLHKKQNPDGYQRRFELSVWDTSLAVSALRMSGASLVSKTLLQAAEWLINAQTIAGGEIWSNVPSGGWSYNSYNIIYPDNDDTSLALISLSQVTMKSYTKEYKKRVAIERGKRWLLYMQNDDGGWATFDKNLNKKKPKVPPTALEDPSVPDITGHVLSALGKLGYKTSDPSIERGIEYLKRDQTDEGAWYGRWGLCYVYGTSCVLIGLKDIGEDMDQFYVRKAVSWLKKNQNKDGGWGEEFSGWDPSLGLTYTKIGKSTVEQTAWAIMGLLAAREDPNSSVIEKGISYILNRQQKDGSWFTQEYTVLGLNPYRNTLYPDYWSLMALGIYSQYKYGAIRIREKDQNLNSLFWPSALETYSLAIKKMPQSSLGTSRREEINLETKGREEISASLIEFRPDETAVARIVLSNTGTDLIKDLKVKINDNKDITIGTLEAGHSQTFELKLDQGKKVVKSQSLSLILSYKNSENKSKSITKSIPLEVSPLKKHSKANKTWIFFTLLVFIASFLLRKKIPRFELIKFAFGNLKKNRLRTVLSMLGMIVGVATISGTLSLGLSFQDRLSKDFANFWTGQILILPYEFQIQAGPPKEIIGDNPPAKFNEQDIQELKKIANVKLVCPQINVQESGEFAGKKTKLYLALVDTNTFYETSSLKLASGRFISGMDRNAVNLGYSIAHSIFPEEIKEGMKIKIGSENYNVAGIFKDVGGIPGRVQTITSPNILVYAPLNVAYQFVTQDYYDEIILKVEDEKKIAETSKAIERVLKVTHTGEQLSTVYTKKFQDKIAGLLNQFNIIIIVIGAFSLLVSGLGIMNIMLVSVTERKREIGILKALGAKEDTILKIFLIEATSLGLISGLIGCVLGYLVLIILQNIAQLYAPFNPLLLLLLSMFFALTVGIVSGTYPAYKASKLDPVVAIRYE